MSPFDNPGRIWLSPVAVRHNPELGPNMGPPIVSSFPVAPAELGRMDPRRTRTCRSGLHPAAARVAGSRPRGGGGDATRRRGHGPGGLGAGVRPGAALAGADRGGDDIGDGEHHLRGAPEGAPGY